MDMSIRHISFQVVREEGDKIKCLLASIHRLAERVMVPKNTPPMAAILPTCLMFSLVDTVDAEAIPARILQLHDDTDSWQFAAEETDLLDPSRWLTSMISTPDGKILSQRLIPKAVFSWNLAGPGMRNDVCVTEFSDRIIELHDKLEAQQGSRINLPLFILRVRDVVQARALKEAFTTVGLQDVEVITDNVADPQRPEAEIVLQHTFCGGCRALAPDNQRCTGCLVAFYCSPKCQKDDWKRHKAECKASRKRQKAWDDDFAAASIERASSVGDH